MNLPRLLETIHHCHPITVYGRITQAIGLILEGHGVTGSVGELCEVVQALDAQPILAETVGFRHQRMLVMPQGDVRGIGPASYLRMLGQTAHAPVGPLLLGRILDGLGRPLDQHGPVRSTTHYPLHAQPLNPLGRPRIATPLDVGIRAINGLLTCGRGQKLGIFAGAGVGKSVLLGMISRYTAADVNVIALIGERGREVNEFLERDLKAEGLARSVVIVATSDQPALVRIRGAYLATAMAEYFRDRGHHVLLLMDSLTRFAQAQREVGLAIGEPPTTKGYTPAVFAALPKLLERTGVHEVGGSITGLYTVLVEGDELLDPIADSARSILDGHIILSRELAAQNHFPAIDPLHSTSRVMNEIVSPPHSQAARQLRTWLATYRRSEDLLTLGAYKPGGNPLLDTAVGRFPHIQAFLQQDVTTSASFTDSVTALHTLVT